MGRVTCLKSRMAEELIDRINGKAIRLALDLKTFDEFLKIDMAIEDSPQTLESITIKYPKTFVNYKDYCNDK